MSNWVNYFLCDWNWQCYTDWYSVLSITTLHQYLHHKLHSALFSVSTEINEPTHHLTDASWCHCDHMTDTKLMD